MDVTFTLKNNGRYDGDEVAQVYVKLPEYGGVAPIKELKGFKRETLKKGQSSKVTISLKKELLRYWDESKGEFVTPSGEYQVFVGASSSDIRLTGTIRL